MIKNEYEIEDDLTTHLLEYEQKVCGATNVPLSRFDWRKRVDFNQSIKYSMGGETTNCLN